jgi:site-specific DNA-cytosine methylase
MGNLSWSKNKKVNFDFYINEAISSNCELPIAIDEQNVKIRTDGTVGTLTTDGSSPKKNNRIMEVDKLNNIRIRKLTPTECYKLMGFTAEDCKKVSEGGISNAQLYKQAGNSIVVNVLEAIFTSLGETYKEFEICR